MGLNECVLLVLERVTFFKTDQIKVGFAGLYSRIFQYFADEINSFPSTRTAKVIGFIYAGDYEDHFAEQVRKIEAASREILPAEAQNKAATSKSDVSQTTKYDRIVDSVGQSRTDAEKEALENKIQHDDLVIKKQKSRLANSE